MALVIKKWYVSRTKDETGNYINIVGREAGLLSWILTMFKVDPTTSVEIKENIILFSKGSLEGFEKRVIPMASICSAYYGYKKPWKEALIIGLVLLPVFGLGLIIGPLYYSLNKTLTVGIVEYSGCIDDFSFKRSIIEGENITENKAYHVIDVIRELIEAKTAK